ncbi:MAG: CpXC domain-containing protein [Chloroflexota bacterium]|nr:CpXC domain-containing protein [Chloroflexota bacterium]
MSQVMLAHITCPSCQNSFQAPVEQVLDVRNDPNAKVRVLNGLINVADCPHCGMRGALNLPFLYHDPDNDLALIYMPMEAGRDDLKRQQFIGSLTSAVMDSLPPEERKAYLLQPQVFLTMESLINKILEADGVTPEMIEAQKAKLELLQRMLDATSDEVLEAMIKENDDVIDADILQMLAMNLEVAQSSGQAANTQPLLALHNKLLDLSSAGRAVKARGETVKALRAAPTREKLLDLLVCAPDEQTRELLITFGRPLLDYRFFQSLTSLVDSASDEDERERLVALRTEVLDIRDRLDEATRALYAERSALLRDLLLSDDPETLARRRFSELDQVFFNLLTTNMEEAQSAGNVEAAKSLQAVGDLVLRLMEETLPPEIQLFNRLVAAEDDAEIEKLLQENHALVTENLVQFMEAAEADMREEGSLETAERFALMIEKAKGVLAESGVY